jgi:Protein of unknown function (DUF3040)
VPLSEHEQRLLEQMERALYAEDPKFASQLRGRDPRSNFRRRVALAAFGVVAGVVLLMTGLFVKGSSGVLVSVIGFLTMLGSALFAVTSYRSLSNASRLGVVDGAGSVRRPQQAAGGRRPRDHRSFMDRVEARWNRRKDENGR